MRKEKILEILENAKDGNGAVPMRLVRTAFDKLPEPCEDTISRQAAIDAIMNNVTPYGLIDDDGNIESGCKDKDVVEMLYNLPSAQPEPKEGHWIEVAGELECSECHTVFTDLYPDYADSVACPHCGAHMKGERQK